MLLFVLIVLLLCRRRWYSHPYWGYPRFYGPYGPQYYGNGYGYGWQPPYGMPYGYSYGCYRRPYRWWW